jgi:hypothetical protein
MPRLCRTTPDLPDLIRAQDFVVRRDQLIERGMTPAAINHRLATSVWQSLVRTVYVCHPGEPSRRQLLIGAQLAVPDGAIDDADACRFHGFGGVTVDDQIIRMVVPQSSSARSRGFVVVRRTSAPIHVVSTDLVSYLSLAPALIAATRGMASDRQVLAVLSDAVQRKLVSFDELLTAHIQATRRSARRADDALEQLADGIRSAPEGDFRKLAISSLVLPELLYNCTLRLQGGRFISPDALDVEAGLVHETNGRRAHRRADLFEDMQERHDVMTAAGLIVLHNSPARVRRRGREVLAEFERCHERYAGRGLPEGIVIVNDGRGRQRDVG